MDILAKYIENETTKENTDVLKPFYFQKEDYNNIIYLLRDKGIEKYQTADEIVFKESGVQFTTKCEICEKLRDENDDIKQQIKKNIFLLLLSLLLFSINLIY